MKHKAVLSIVTLAILAGCGGGGDDSPGVAVSPSPQAPPAPPPASGPTPTPTSPIVAPPPATPPAASAPADAAPSRVQNFTATGGESVADLAWSHSAENDVTGYLVWRDVNPDFKTAPGNLIHDVVLNTLKDTIPITQDTHFYYRIAAYDTFNKNLTGNGLNVSPPVVAVVKTPVISAPPPNSPPPPPPPPPQPAAGTFILGSIVKRAMQSNPNLGNCNQYYYYYSYNPSCDTTAYEAVAGVPDRSKQGIQVGYWTGATYYQHYSYPTRYDYNNPNPKYPNASQSFQIVYPNSIFALSKTATTYAGNKEKALVRSAGDFEIRDDHKFILDKTAAQWDGVEGENYYFLQLQISTFSASNTVFKLCWHQYFPDVRRLACTLHNKDTGQYRGTQVIDDSRGLGQTEYLPLNE